MARQQVSKGQALVTEQTDDASFSAVLGAIGHGGGAGDAQRLSSQAALAEEIAGAQ